MKKRLLTALTALVLLTSCTPKPGPEKEGLRVLAATYPVYLFTTAVTGDTEGVEVELLVNAQTSCLHDYTLTVDNMKAIEQADVIVMNGAGLEDFLSAALSASEAAVIDCSEAVELLYIPEYEGHEGHGRKEYDPHYWMDPNRACQAVETVAEALAALDEGHAQDYRANAQAALESMDPDGLGSAARYLCTLATGQPSLSELVSHPGFITFHDGFQYFAQAFGLELLKAIEEEEGASASAAEIEEIVKLIDQHDLPAIFVEKNGSWATAETIAGEVTDRFNITFTIAQLDLFMSGTALAERHGMDAYTDLMVRNIQTVARALQ